MIDNPSRIIIGDGSSINRFCQFYTGKSKTVTIKIGSRTWVGCNSTFICISHEIGDHFQRAGKNSFKSIEVGDGCWIGANVTVLPNVKIGDGVIVAAGSVVVHDCENDSLYAGVPAKKIKTL